MFFRAKWLSLLKLFHLKSFICLKHKNFYHDFRKKAIPYFEQLSNQMLEVFQMNWRNLSRFNAVSETGFFVLVNLIFALMHVVNFVI